MSGLGQDDGTDDGTDDGSTGGDDSGGITLPYAPGGAQVIPTYGGITLPYAPGGAQVIPTNGVYAGPSVTTNSNQNNALATALANFGAAWTKIAGQVIAPQVTETGPGGTSITGPAAALQSILGAGVNLGGTNYSLLLIVGVAVAGLFLVSSMGKK